VVDAEADLLAVEALRPIHVGDRHRHHLERPVHRNVPPERPPASRTYLRRLAPLLWGECAAVDRASDPIRYLCRPRTYRGFTDEFESPRQSNQIETRHERSRSEVRNVFALAAVPVR
jgi:hypothetical protein